MSATTGRKKSPLDPSCCPVCGITLRSSDLEVHFVQELERLERVSRTFRSSSHHHHHHHGSSGGRSISPSGSSGAMSAPAATSQVQKREQDTRWETFHRIRINRTNRVRAKARKRRADEREDTPENGHHHPHLHHAAMGGGNAGSSSGSSSTPCPICGQRMYGSAEELNQHVVQCLRRNGEDADEDEPLDVEGDSYEEYEWAGQRRIRASTMLEGGFGGVGMHICKAGDEETEDVVVDGDDTAAFGQPQFNEHDIQTAAADHTSQEEGIIKCERDAQMSSAYKETDSKDHIINALKNRVCDLEEMNKEAKQKNRCLICLGDYRQPVVSTSCWHVHCEECWLQALGNKKLCPQCNLITSPTHLRRIYM
ncbi:hypothetical protein DAPPUDRAFT_325740 [Daphnia pulex]|uniref:RING-type domain-containing protein n=1 Tax=Daphnia pulex TaxID=6669 RepID=E9H5F0_DAPPU|nr:hypothetical protein DAPPUDRAFT_325740 [Daphnia pulex]|eukprot:EFX73016.1 hypothetical protein DAPPUDRAFT_325740 [Daphnia pulex]